jgi:hypothetical protein
VATRRTRRPASSDTELTTTNQLLLAVLQLLVQDREARSEDGPMSIKTEVLLDRVGLGSATIALLVDKQPGAVRTILSREKAKNLR